MKFRPLFWTFAALAWAGAAHAQTPMQPYFGDQAPSATGPRTYMQPVDVTHPLPVIITPSAAVTPLAGNASGSTGAVVGTLTATATTTAYISGFSVSAIGGTASVGPITIAGLAGGSQTYQLLSSAGGSTLYVNFATPIPASAVNTNITITTTADGTATAVNVNSWGFRQ
jgi:hypothetical protein